MIRYISIVVLWCTLLPAMAQLPKLVQAEYFIDQDPGTGQGTDFSISAGTTVNEAMDIDVSVLSKGMHTLFIRFRNDSGTWGHAIGQPFFIATHPAKNIQA